MYALADNVFSVNDSTFESVALEVFRFQYEGIRVYRAFCDSFGRDPETVYRLSDIPFLPVEFFKHHRLIAEGKTAQKVFESSGTTASVPSMHEVADLFVYEKSFMNGFRLFYGEPIDYVLLALLPSYMERSNSSLIYMAEHLMQAGTHPENGFYLNDFEKLKRQLQQLKERKQRTILLGVTFALLDFAERNSIHFPELILMETGGMKGRREELTRMEVHEQLKNAFGVQQIHSEYGMTELLSQGYSKGGGVFKTPPWMKVLIRDADDPLQIARIGKPGALNVIDLANIYSCSFIATSDLGRVNEDGSFEVSGRQDAAEVRGCNLMVV